MTWVCLVAQLTPVFQFFTTSRCLGQHGSCRSLVWLRPLDELPVTTGCFGATTTDKYCCQYGYVVLLCCSTSSAAHAAGGGRCRRSWAWQRGKPSQRLQWPVLNAHQIRNTSNVRAFASVGYSAQRCGSVCNTMVGNW